MKKPPPGHNAQKRPDFKGFHGFTGLSGKSVKALSLYEISLEAWSKVATYPSPFSHRGKVKKCEGKYNCVKKIKRFIGKIKKCSFVGFSEDSHSVGGLNIIWLNAHVIAPSLGCHQSGKAYVTLLCEIYAKLS